MVCGEARRVRGDECEWISSFCNVQDDGYCNSVETNVTNRGVQGDVSVQRRSCFLDDMMDDPP